MIEVIELSKWDEEAFDAFADLIKQLSPSASIKKVTMPLKRKMLKNKHIFVAWEGDIPVGTFSILMEDKINRGAVSKTVTQKVAHIEEVVVHHGYRGCGIGKIMMDHAVEFCKKLKCYKIILDCSRENVAFYEKCGFHEHEVCMRMDI